LAVTRRLPLRPRQCGRRHIVRETTMAKLLDSGRDAVSALTDEDPTAFFEAIGNRKQILLFTLLTVILSGVAVWGITYWVRHPTPLTFAVGSESGIEARFAAKLAAVLKNESSKISIQPVSNGDATKMVSRFERKQADLAIIRTDVKAPARGRAVSILDKDVMLLIGPKNSKLKNLSALAGKKIAILGEDDRNEKFVRQLLAMYNVPTAKITLQTVPQGSDIEKLLAPNNYALVVTLEHLSRLAADRSFEKLVQKGYVFHGVEESKAIERKLPGAGSETLETGLLSTSPLIPSDDLDTIGLDWVLVAQSKISEQKIAELARILYENKGDLAMPGEFANKIEPADTDKDAFIVAHPGAAQYINDDIRSFVDRYSDLAYLAVACLSVIGSIFLGLYTAVTRVAPEKAGALSAEMLDIGEKVQETKTIDELDALQDEFESILRRVLHGLRDGSVSSDGLDTFQLGYDFVKSTLDLHRQALVRRAAREPVAPRAVQSA
jgi:TRAP-type uncharacterized transport system substrate-binding protein